MFSDTGRTKSSTWCPFLRGFCLFFELVPDFARMRLLSLLLQGFAIAMPIPKTAARRSLPPIAGSENELPASSVAFRFADELTGESEVPAELATVESVTALLDSIQKDTALDPAHRERLMQSLATTLEQLKLRTAHADRLAGITKAIAAAPEATVPCVLVK